MEVSLGVRLVLAKAAVVCNCCQYMSGGVQEYGVYEGVNVMV